MKTPSNLPLLVLAFLAGTVVTMVGTRATGALDWWDWFQSDGYCLDLEEGCLQSSRNKCEEEIFFETAEECTEEKYRWLGIDPPEQNREGMRAPGNASPENARPGNFNTAPSRANPQAPAGQAPARPGQANAGFAPRFSAGTETIARIIETLRAAMEEVDAIVDGSQAADAVNPIIPENPDDNSDDDTTDESNLEPCEVGEDALSAQLIASGHRRPCTRQCRATDCSPRCPARQTCAAQRGPDGVTEFCGCVWSHLVSSASSSSEGCRQTSTHPQLGPICGGPCENPAEVCRFDWAARGRNCGCLPPIN